MAEPPSIVDPEQNGNSISVGMQVKQMQQQITKLKKQIKNNAKLKKDMQPQIVQLEQQIDHLKQTPVPEPTRNIPEQSFTANPIPRQQRRKLRKQQAQDEFMNETRLLAASMPNYAETELELLTRVLNQHRLQVHDIPPDGHCLFNAIAHQLQLTEFPLQHTYQSLRTLAGAHILQNKHDYIPFMIDEQSGNQMSLEQLDEYVNLLIHTPMWGGHTEIKALSTSLERAIHVYHPHAPNPIVTGSEYSEDGCLRICYVQHQFGLGEHYNSIMDC